MERLEQIETGSFARGGHTPKHSNAIRIVSWNIARGCRFEEIAGFLADANADLILLQEVDRHARRTGRLNVTAELAKRLAMNFAFGIEFEELAEGSTASPAYHGQAILSPLPLSHCRILRFSRQSKFWHPHWWAPTLPCFQRRRGGRTALVSHVRFGEALLAAYSIHLESRGNDDLRRAQLAEVLADTRAYYGTTAVFVAGDFNFDVTENRTASAIEEREFLNVFDDARAHSTARSFGRSAAIDWILVRRPLQWAAPRVHGSVLASDHYPLSVTIRLS